MVLPIGALALVAVVGGFFAFGVYHLAAAFLGHGGHLIRAPTARQALLYDDSNPPCLLLLGPSAAGKTTLYRHAVALAGEALPQHTGGPTRGLVRHPLFMPCDRRRQLPEPVRLPAPGGFKAATSSTRRRRRVVVCDAGGGRQERRQWVELVRPPARIGVLVFVADARDGTEETLSLFKQLANAKWARGATLIVALTFVDRLVDERGAATATHLCSQREAELRAVCAHPFSVHALNGRDDADAAERLLTEAVQDCGTADAVE